MPEHDHVAVACEATVLGGTAYRTAVWCRTHKAIEAWPTTVGTVQLGAVDLPIEDLPNDVRAELITSAFKMAIAELMAEYEREQAAPMN